MKKLFLSTTLAFAAASGFGQGQLIFGNFSATAITNAVTGVAAAGSSAQNDTQVGLYIGNVGEAVNTLTLSGNVTNCYLPGRFSGGTRTLAGRTGTIQIQVRAWLANTVYPTYEAASAAAMGGDTSVLLGVSAPFNFTLTLSPDIPVSIASAGLTPIILGFAGSVWPPYVYPDSLSALLIGTNAADASRTIRLSAYVDSGAQPTMVRFQYGLTSSYPATNSVGVPASVNGTDVSVILPFSPGFTYHWNVVASNSLGTSTSPDRTFTVASAGSGVLGDQNGDGIVSQVELDTVYANYVTSSPWLLMTNVAGLGGTNVTFALSNAELGAYGVEYSTNLIDWLPLGSASPRYGFTDAHATVSPVRHYRLRSP